MAFKRDDSKYWWITINGKKVSSKTTVRADAEAMEADHVAKSWRNEQMGVKPPRSWKEACVKWGEERTDKVSLADDLVKIKWFEPHLGNVTDLNKITREVMHKILSENREGISVRDETPANATANRFSALVCSILNAAADEWEWGNLPRKFRKYPENSDGVGRALKLDEWRKLEAQLNPHMKLCATFALATGMREAKVFGLRWDQIDFAERTLTFKGAGNKLGNTIPLNDTAIAVLKAAKALPVVHKDFVFTYTRMVWPNGRMGRFEGDVKVMKVEPMTEHGQAAWKKAVERAGIGHVRWHDLRHTFCSWLYRKGIGEKHAKQLMGHEVRRGKGAHNRYIHFEIEDLRPSTAVIDMTLAGAVTVTAGEGVSKTA